MGLRLRKSIKVFPGLTLNLSKSGVSASVGMRGAHVTVGKKGIRKTVDLPGTGISYTDYQRHGGSAGTPKGAADPHAVPHWLIALVAFLLLAHYLARY